MNKMKICGFLIMLTSNLIFGQCEDNEYSTIGVLDDINEEIYNDDESVNAYSIYSWTSDDINRILSGNGITTGKPVAIASITGIGIPSSSGSYAKAKTCADL